MKKRLFMVDYREKGESKHHAIELVQVGAHTDSEIVKACHEYVGKNTVLDGVIEVFIDMTAEELNNISQSPISLFLPKRALYFNYEEVQRVSGMMQEGKQ